MDLSPQQLEAESAVRRWLDGNVLRNQPTGAPWFYLAGYAGTGKTSIAQHLASLVEGRVLFGSFTGKATLVMRRKGCANASTLHRLVYLAGQRSGERLSKLEAELETVRAQPPRTGSTAMRADLEHVARLNAEITAEKRALRNPTWSVNPASELQGAALLVVDECSMVGDKLARDLLSFETPVLALGDPAQLPPVKSGGFFTQREPDFQLTEIHRQALDSPVLGLATLARQGQRLPEGRDGDSAVLPWARVKVADLLAYDQVICGRNATRRALNQELRGLLGRRGAYPVPGDRVVCLKNDRDTGLLNGGTWEVLACQEAGEELLALRVGDGEEELECLAWKAPFRGEEVDPRKLRDAQSFDFAYALTAHKAQGSSWPAVAVIDEGACFRQDEHRWRYTSITRASERVLVVR